MKRVLIAVAAARARRGRCRRRLLPARAARVARRARLVDGRVRDDARRRRRRRRSRASPGRPTARTPSGSGSRTASSSRRRFAAPGRSARRRSSSSRRRSPTGGSSSRTTPACCSRSARRTASEAWKYVSHRCVAASPAVDRHVVYETFLNAPPCNRKPSAQLTGELVAFAVGTGRVLWRKRIAPSESSPVVVGGLGLRRRLERPRLRVPEAHRQALLVDEAARPGEGRRRGRRRARCTSATTRATSTRSNVRTGRIVWQAKRAAALRARRQLLRRRRRVAYGRVYIGATDGKVYSFGAVEREAALVAVDRRLRLLVAGRLARPRLRRLVLAPLLRVRRGDRRDPLAVHGERADLRLADGRSPAASTSRRSKGTTYALDATNRRAGSGRSPTASTRRSSPTRTGSTSSATRASTASTRRAPGPRATLSAASALARAAAGRVPAAAGHRHASAGDPASAPTSHRARRNVCHIALFGAEPNVRSRRRRHCVRSAADAVRRHRRRRVHRLAPRARRSQAAATRSSASTASPTTTTRRSRRRTRAGSTSARVDLAEDALDFARLRRRLPPRRASRACAASATSSRSTSAATCSPRSASSRRPRATGSRSSSRRRRRSTAPPSATRRPRTRRRTRSRRTGSASSPASSSPTRTRAQFGLDCVVAPLLQRVRPAAASRHGVHADRQRARRRAAASSSSATATQSRSWTYVGDVVDGTIAAMRAGSGTYNVGGALEASMNESIALFERISGRTLDVGATTSRCRATSGGRRPTRRGSATELGWEPRVSLEDGAASASGRGRRLDVTPA